MAGGIKVRAKVEEKAASRLGLADLKASALPKATLVSCAAFFVCIEPHLMI